MYFAAQVTIRSTTTSSVYTIMTEVAHKEDTIRLSL